MSILEVSGVKYPAGYSVIPADTFEGESFKEYGYKKTPVTNAEYADHPYVDHFILLQHDEDNTGATKLVNTGTSAREAMQGPVNILSNINFDKGDFLKIGGLILLRMVENPSRKYNDDEGIFSGGKQPAVGVTYYHGDAWNLIQGIKFLEFEFLQPTDAQHYYVASNKGTQEYGTENGKLFHAGGGKLARLKVKDWRPVDVDKSAYKQNLPFGVQTTGNVWRWSRFNKSKEWKYGLRGGSGRSRADNGHASFRHNGTPHNCYNDVGFSSVVARRGVWQ